jgi:hypothetical protein
MAQVCAHEEVTIVNDKMHAFSLQRMDHCSTAHVPGVLNRAENSNLNGRAGFLRSPELAIRPVPV